MRSLKYTEYCTTTNCSLLILLSLSLFPFVQSLDHSIAKAVEYLEKRLPGLTYSYAVAMTSYALAIEKKLNKEILYNYVSQGVVTQLYF